MNTSPAAPEPRLYTVGHSNHPYDDFVALLGRHGVDLVVDVRLVPYSRRFPQYRKDALERHLPAHGIGYRWLGDALGGIKRGSAFRSFAEKAASPQFRDGLDELRRLAAAHTAAVMCAEREPLDCHRSVLVTRQLRGTGLAIRHIHADGSLEDNTDFEQRLVAATKTGAAPLLEDPAATVEAAYDARAAKMTGAG